MKSKIPCDIIRDLFPSYLDGLTSETTNKEVDGHLEECEDCKAVLERMKEPKNMLNRIENSDDLKEIEFLKKVKRRLRMVVIGSICILFFVVVGLLIRNRLYGNVVTDDLEDDMILYDVDIQGKKVTVKGCVLDENFGGAGGGDEGMPGMEVVDGEFRGLTYQDGDVMHVRAPIATHKRLGGEPLIPRFSYSCDVQGGIGEIWARNKIVWKNGEEILPRTAAVYREAHDYVGDHVANGRLTKVLGLSTFLSKRYEEWNTALQTKKEPYGFSIRIKQGENEVSKEDINQLKNYGYVLLASIGNLSEMNFEFYDVLPVSETDEPKNTVRVTKEDAEKFAAENMEEKIKDIHEIGKDAKMLQELLKKTHILDIAYPNRSQGVGDSIRIRLYDFMEDLRAVKAELKIEGNKSGGQQVFTAEETNSDGTDFSSGFFEFEIRKEDFKEMDFSEPVRMVFSFQDNKKNEFRRNIRQGIDSDAGQEKYVEIFPEFGDTYGFLLKGNEKDGYQISQ